MDDIQKENEQKITATDLFLLTAHDISTALTTTRWALETIQNGDRGPLTQEQRDIISEIQRQNSQSIDLIHTTIKSIEHGALNQTSISEVDLEAILTESIKSTTIEADKHGVTFNYHPSGNTPHIRGDNQALLMVFRALIKNAIQYGNENTPVTINTHTEGDTIYIEVKNEGAGIPEEQQAHVFERFFRGKSRSKECDGFGLGLYGAKKIITEHRGNISFISSTGHGATFTITLPVGDSK